MAKSPLEVKLIRNNSSPLNDYHKVIEANADLLDALYRLTFIELNQDDYDYLISQITQTANYVTVYQRRLKKGNIQRRYLDQNPRTKKTLEAIKPSQVAQNPA